MLFNSLDFAVFFPVVTLGFFLLPHGLRWAWLLAASCYFYMAFVPVYILILLFTIVIDYIAGIVIEKSQGTRRRLWLVVSLAANIGILAVFKYFNFFNANLAALAKALDLNYPVKMLEIMLPIGLSFHTFQAMSYTIEVYRGNQKAERHFGIYALYVMFYPQLVAGPIERPQNILHQFKEKHYFEHERVVSGLRLMAWGLFKKVVIADRLAAVVNKVFAAPDRSMDAALVVGTVFFAYQIYCDFSGYSDIAIGSARVMGFTLMKNFDRPYVSQSVGEFWRRWHISLSTWFRDYLYIPMGGGRVGAFRKRTNLMVTFLMSGLWHGANWTYVVWGGLNGLYLIAGDWTLALRNTIWGGRFLERVRPLRKAVAILVTFFLINTTWVLFRADSLAQAAGIFRRLPGGIADLLSLSALRDPVFYKDLGMHRAVFLISLALIVFLEVAQKLHAEGFIGQRVFRAPTLVRWSAYSALIFCIAILGVFVQTQFIYFQF